MKKFTKLFLACAAVTAVTAAIATTAMAATPVTGDVTGSYAEGTVTLESVPAGATTVLVLDKNADTTAVKDEDILYISQDDITTTSIKLKGAPTEADATDAIVLFGCYENPADKTGFKILKAKIGETAGEEVLVGDATGDDKISTKDATAILKNASSGGAEGIEAEYVERAAYANGDYKVSTKDATCVLKCASNNGPTGAEGEYAGVRMVIPANPAE